MKLLITVMMCIAVAVSGLFSLHYFRASVYDLSWLLDITAYGSIVAGIYLITAQKRKRLLQ
ncbi:MAG TPA: hypothetical protein VKU83_12360 [Puia sp.]|nr:hypothetical protein [Puia sp.]